MKIEEIEKAWEKINKDKFPMLLIYEIALDYMPKLISVAKAAKKLNANINEFGFDSKYVGGEIELDEALEDLECDHNERQTCKE